MLVTELFPGAEVRDWATTFEPRWQLTNPSIAYHPLGGYRATLRAVNYAMDEATLEYPNEDPQNAIRTRTLLATCDSQWNILGAEPIDDTAVQKDAYPWVRGMEDCRLYFGWDDKWHVYGTLREHRADGLCTMADDALQGATVVERKIFPHPLEKDRPEKNWMAVDRGQSFVYMCKPRVNILASGTIARHWPEPGSESDCPNGEGFRGGSQVVPYRNGYLGIIHEVGWGDNPRRNYTHRIVRFDQQAYMCGYSQPFNFRSPGVEFAAGLATHGDRLTISVGYKDRSCLLCTIPTASLPW